MILILLDFHWVSVAMATNAYQRKWRQIHILSVLITTQPVVHIRARWRHPSLTKPVASLIGRNAVTNFHFFSFKEYFMLYTGSVCFCLPERHNCQPSFYQADRFWPAGPGKTCNCGTDGFDALCTSIAKEYPPNEGHVDVKVLANAFSVLFLTIFRVEYARQTHVYISLVSWTSLLRTSVTNTDYRKTLSIRQTWHPTQKVARRYIISNGNIATKRNLVVTINSRIIACETQHEVSSLPILFPHANDGHESSSVVPFLALFLALRPLCLRCLQRGSQNWRQYPRQACADACCATDRIVSLVLIVVALCMNNGESVVQWSASQKTDASSQFDKMPFIAGVISTFWEYRVVRAKSTLVNQ